MEIGHVHMFFSAELADALFLFAGEFAGKSAACGKAARDGDNFGGNSLFAADSAQQTPHALLIALIEEQFGAQAPKLVQKIEQHPDTPEGRAAAVQACVKFIRLFIDEKQAQAFAQRAQELLPD